MIANVRMAKAKLSEFLTRAAAGEEIVITSDGKPKAKLVGIPAIHAHYHVNRRLLTATPRKPGMSAEELIRLDRDGRD
jgi:prevent-host-death family protein